MKEPDKKKFSKENWEMEVWLRNHEISLDEKYDFGNKPGRKQKKTQSQSRLPRHPEATLDLHGLTVQEAETELKSFLHSSKLKGYSIIKIIHGKGLHSAGEAKLGALVKGYLNGVGKNQISTWQNAPINQGGEGAVIVFF